MSRMQITEFRMSSAADQRARDASVFRLMDGQRTVFAQGRTAVQAGGERPADRVRDSDRQGRNSEQNARSNFEQARPDADTNSDRHWDPPASDPETGTGGGDPSFDQGGGHWAM